MILFMSSRLHLARACAPRWAEKGAVWLVVAFAESARKACREASDVLATLDLYGVPVGGPRGTAGQRLRSCSRRTVDHPRRPGGRSAWCLTCGFRAREAVRGVPQLAAGSRFQAPLPG